MLAKLVQCVQGVLSMRITGVIVHVLHDWQGGAKDQ